MQQPNLEHVFPRTVGEWVLQKCNTTGAEEFSESPILPILFGGDRLSCCDEAYVCRSLSGEILGAVTISRNGQMGEGPEIVGLYVLPEYRRRGYGDLLLKLALLRLDQQELLPAKICILSTAMMELISHLQSWFKDRVIVTMEGKILDLLMMEGGPK